MPIHTQQQAVLLACIESSIRNKEGRDYRKEVLNAMTESKQTPVPTTLEELNKLSRWTVHIMNQAGRFDMSSDEIKKEVELIVDSCRESL